MLIVIECLIVPSLFFLTVIESHTQAVYNLTSECLWLYITQNVFPSLIHIALGYMISFGQYNVKQCEANRSFRCARAIELGFLYFWLRFQLFWPALLSVIHLLFSFGSFIALASFFVVIEFRPFLKLRFCHLNEICRENRGKHVFSPPFFFSSRGN